MSDEWRRDVNRESLRKTASVRWRSTHRRRNRAARGAWPSGRIGGWRSKPASLEFCGCSTPSATTKCCVRWTISAEIRSRLVSGNDVSRTSLTFESIGCTPLRPERISPLNGGAPLGSHSVRSWSRQGAERCPGLRVPGTSWMIDGVGKAPIQWGVSDSSSSVRIRTAGVSRSSNWPSRTAHTKIPATAARTTTEIPMRSARISTAISFLSRPVYG